MSIELDATATDGGAATRGRSDRLTAGDLLAHFRAERLLGQGAMGDVWLATDLALDRPVAIKVLPPDVARDPGRRERLLREARAQARIQHPHVCHIYYVGEEGDRVFFAMEYIPGETLAERLERGPIPPDEALEIARMAALGLREGYRHGFTHRDIKPSNLMLDGHGQLKVVDFGLVTRGEIADPAAGEAVTQTALVGTPLYMAPEQARGEAVDFRADVYALGATLHHLICGRPPFAGTTAADLRSQHEGMPRPALVASGRPHRRLAALLDPVLARMMAKATDQRFRSYDELIAELERISPVRTRPAGFFVRAVALCIDFLIVILLGAMTSSALSYGDESSVDALISIAVGALYGTVAVWRWGATAGRALFELRVVSTATDRPPPLRAAAVRWLVAFGPLCGSILLELLLKETVPRFRMAGQLLIALSCVYWLAMVAWAAMRRADKCLLWDRAAHTMVRYRRAQG